ncbi:SH3 domain-containing protein [Candidatus Omnitrophota bacterium]
MRKKTVIVIGLVCLLFCSEALCKEQFPALYQISVDKSNIRAGYNINFEILKTVEKDENIIVLDKQYGWYGVKLPLDVACYISSKYVLVDKINKAQSAVTANRVNVRARPDLHSTVLCQVGTINKINVLRQENEDWYAIEPPAECIGWISKENLEFASYDIIEEKLAPQPKEETQPQETTQQAETAVAQPKESEQVPDTTKESSHESKKSPEIFTGTGIVRPMGIFFGRKGTHKLVQNKKLACYLKGDKKALDAFSNQRVELSGTIVSPPSAQYPIVAVDTITRSQ